MARRNGEFNSSLSRGMIFCLVLSCICCNIHLFFAHASHATERETSNDSGTLKLSPPTFHNADDDVQFTPETPSPEEPPSSPATIEDEPVDDAESASGWLNWNPFSTVIQWVKSYFSPSTDEDGGSDAENVPTTQGASEDNISRRLFSMGKLSSLLSRPSTTKKSQKQADPLQYYPDQCPSALCQEIAMQMQIDIDYGADPCTAVNEHYCGNWMRRTKIPDGEDKWNISTDAVHESSADFLISTIESLSCPTSATLPQAAVQDQWDSLLACSYQMCMDEDTLNIQGAKPLFAAMFDQDNDTAPSLSFLVQSDFDEEATAARQADRLIQMNIESPEADAIIASVDSLIAAADEVPTEAPSTGNGKVINPKHKSLLRILVPRLRSIYRRLNAQFFWSLMVAPHELDATKGHTLIIADLILGLPYRYYAAGLTEKQLHYEKYLARLLRAFDTHLSQHQREIYEKGKASNPNMKLSYEERASRIFKFEAGVLRSAVLSPEQLRDVQHSVYSVTFGELKNSAEFIDVEAIIKMYMQDFTAPPSAAGAHEAIRPRNINGITITDSGEIVINDKAEFNIYQRNYFSQIGKRLYDPKNWAVLHDYILVNLIRNQAKYLSEDFRSATDEFLTSSNGKALAGRSRRCLHTLPQWLLGRLYVRNAFPEENKMYVTEMFQKVKSALYSKIEQSTWMDESTRTNALEKLAAMKAKIGYPEWLVDPLESHTHFEKYYGKGSVALDVAQKGYHELVNHMRKQEIVSELMNYGTLPDLEMWDSLPHKSGEAYVMSHNEMRLPAAFLQKPVFYMPSSNASREELLVAKAINYGGLAAFIGRELAHAVNEGGGEFDADGHPESGWTVATVIEFGNKLQCLAKQYSSYSVEMDVTPTAEETHQSVQERSPSAGVNAAAAKQAAMSASAETPEGPIDRRSQTQTGAATVAGEEITEGRKNLRKSDKRDPPTATLFIDKNVPMQKSYEDNAGLQVAWAAIQKDLTASDLDEKPLRGLGEFITVKQIFLYGWGHFWCETSKPDFLRKQILARSSIPSRFRSQGALANLDIFAQEYKCSKDTTLNPAQKCTAW